MPEPTPNPNLSETENSSPLPTRFQRKTIWNALTALAIVLIGTIAVGFIILGGKILGFLQPVLVPVAVAGITAYLLEPVIGWLTKHGWKHNRAMMTVYIAFLIAVALLIVAVIVPTVGQASDLMAKSEGFQEQAMKLIKKGYNEVQTKLDIPEVQEYADKGLEAVSKIGPAVGTWLWGKISGVFGLFGYALGMLLVPVYLFFFLREGHSISETWSDYLPLKASEFKDEVVSTLKEINQYLISFFRGQMVVSMIDGVLVAIVLAAIQLPYALLLGVFLAILGLIPYIGNLLVMIPAMLIALAFFGASASGPVVQGGTAKVGEYVKIQVTEKQSVKDKARAEDSNDPTETDQPQEAEPASAEKPEAKTTGKKSIERILVTSVSADGKTAEGLLHAWKWLPNVWAYPLIVLGIFVVLQQINGLVTAPKIVGDSVGLHPLTVIFSVLFWSLMLGGLLGALLAVPLTAALKVLFRRYIWERRIEGQLSSSSKDGKIQDDAGDDNPGDPGSAGDPVSEATT